MPMPYPYRDATKDFRAFLEDAQDRLGTPTWNMTYTAVEGVLWTFRRRLTPAQGLTFADVLPAVLRAMFVYRWDPTVAPLPFASRQELAEEARALRPNHNLTPAHAIEATAWALRRHVNQADLDRVLSRMPSGAVAFWSVPEAEPGDLDRRII